jgi:hypothetical protein
MSLLIVGSCSRVTQNIIKLLSQNQVYTTVTILDLLPTYNFHQRFYRLQKDLKKSNSNITVSLDKLFQLEDLAESINKHDDLLVVTHDYFQSVPSKTKILETTAQLSQKVTSTFMQKKPVFAAPLEYDHFGVTDPQTEFNGARDAVFKANPNATFVRADIQDSTEFLAYLHHPKNIIEESLFKIPETFNPKIVESNRFSEAVL